MSRLGVIGRTHKSYFIIFIYILSHVSKHSRGDSEHHHQHPHAHDHPLHDLLAKQRRHFPGQHQDHHPVHAHQRDQKDGGVHVGVAQVVDAFAHDVAEHPRLLGQVDDEEDGEGHEEAIGTCQVEDEEGGDRASSDACQDAPDDEEVAGDAQEEDQAEDEGTQGCGEVIAHNAGFLRAHVIVSDKRIVHAGRSFDPEDERQS